MKYVYSCREEVSKSTTKHFLSRCAYTSSGWGVWPGCIEWFGGLVSCDERETVGHCVIVINKTRIGLHQTTYQPLIGTHKLRAWAGLLRIPAYAALRFAQKHEALLGNENLTASYIYVVFVSFVFMWFCAASRLSDLTLADSRSGLDAINAQDPWIRLSNVWVFFCGLCCDTCGSLLHFDIGSCVERSPKRYKVIPISLEPLPLLWMKSALHPSSGPPTDASCSCTLLPVCTQTLLSEDIATAKLGHRLNLNGAALNGAMLVGWQEVPVSMALFLLCNQWI